MDDFFKICYKGPYDGKMKVNEGYQRSVIDGSNNVLHIGKIFSSEDEDPLLVSADYTDAAFLSAIKDIKKSASLTNLFSGKDFAGQFLSPTSISIDTVSSFDKNPSIEAGIILSGQVQVTSGYLCKTIASSVKEILGDDLFESMKSSDFIKINMKNSEIEVDVSNGAGKNGDIVYTLNGLSGNTFNSSVSGFARKVEHQWMKVSAGKMLDFENVDLSTITKVGLLPKEDSKNKNYHFLIRKIKGEMVCDIFIDEKRKSVFPYEFIFRFIDLKYKLNLEDSNVDSTYDNSHNNELIELQIGKSVQSGKRLFKIDMFENYISTTSIDECSLDSFNNYIQEEIIKAETAFYYKPEEGLSSAWF